jgi:hypothetical protein
MKLSPERVNQALGQFDAQVVPEDHPSVPQLNDMFGDHTYFVDSNGLNIVEPAAAADGQAAGQVVNVASWSDDSQSRLTPHEPEPTDVVVMLEPGS